MTAQMRNVFSEHVSQVGHDSETGEMLVKWKKNGKTSAYAGVPANLVDEIARSPSVGKRIHEEIKSNPKYTHRYL